MKLFSFNVNGLKSSISKGLINFVFSENPDILCLQEIKCQENLLSLNNYYSYYNYCSQKGYSGTAIFTKKKPLSINYDLEKENFNCEGRIITLEYEKFFIVNVYTPMSKSSIARVDYRMQWDELFFEYITKLERKKPTILCGDFNITYSRLDTNSTIFSQEFIDNELDEFKNLLNCGFIDVFRYKHPKKENAYTWWNITKKKKIGYRIDYFLVSKNLLFNIINSKIHYEIHCSDHFPISLEINFEENNR